ncbi:cobalamin biosynthesis protein [Thiocystis violacea]|uniref:cobalamin biosynthesis protein n=1 Tax=Thiocystis violacea TaxID=13725 RepID=UPI001904D412|nr:cobalamin biosynthesis protein [Thiocystis violacea]MBK1720392.1 cobalamin biosynthesis protein CbiG [Thiocystis violacea]
MVEKVRIVIGIGCQRGVSLTTLECAIAEALQPLGEIEVCRIASHACKADESALLDLARIHGWPLRLYPAASLAAVAVPNPSTRVAGEVGTPSVAEAAALLASGAPELLVEKRAYRGADGKGATVAVARLIYGKVPTRPNAPELDRINRIIQDLQD